MNNLILAMSGMLTISDIGVKKNWFLQKESITKTLKKCIICYL